MSVFSERCARRREALKLSQQDVADLFPSGRPDPADPNKKLSRAAVAQWESGESEPTTDKLARLAKGLRTTVDYLVGASDQEEAEVLSRAEAALLSDYRACTEAQRVIISGTAKQFSGRVEPNEATFYSYLEEHKPAGDSGRARDGSSEGRANR